MGATDLMIITEAYLEHTMLYVGLYLVLTSQVLGGGFFFVKYAQHNIMLLKYVVEMRNWRTPNLKVLNLIQCHANCKGDLAVRIGRKWTFYTFLYAYQKIQFQYTLDIYRVVSLPKNVCTCRSLSLNNDIPRIPLICVLSIAPILNF